MSDRKVKDYLNSIGIEFIIHKHPAVYTCEEAKKLCKNISGIHSKNLLLKGKTTKSFYLIIIPDYKKLDIKYFKEKFKENLEFAKEGDLKSILGVEAGAVSIFSLINDKFAKVKLLLDKEVYESEIVSFHPNINTETLELTHNNLQKYLKSIKNKVEII